MFIRQDGTMPSSDPLKAAMDKGLAVPVSAMLSSTSSPRTPESMGSEGRYTSP